MNQQILSFYAPESSPAQQTVRRYADLFASPNPGNAQWEMN
jgi:hypothetical protein